MKNSSSREDAKTRRVRQKLRFFIVLAAAIWCFLLLNSCIRKSSAPLSYKDFPFNATVETFGFDVDFKARVTFVPKSEESGERLSFELLAPESLGGMEIILGENGAELRLDGQAFVTAELPFDKREGIGKVARMLLPSETVLSIKSESGEACSLPRHERLTVIDTASFTIHIDPESGLPIKITDKASGAFLTVGMIQVDESVSP